MSFTPKPCAHCGGTSHHVFPNLQQELWKPTTVFGMQASQKITGTCAWTFTIVVCTQCGRTDTFTVNGAELAERVKDSYPVTAR